MNQVQPTPAGSVPALGHAEAMVLAATEFDRIIGLLGQLTPQEWGRPTACPLWDIRAMSAHVLGMAEAQASMRQFARDFQAARKREGGAMIDAMNAHQVAERAGLTPADIVAGLAATAPKAVRARRRTPAVVRAAVKMRQDPPFDAERWPFGFIVDTIFTRDTWMHRLDIASAAGRAMHLTPGHDGRLVSNVVAEWARRHGQPFDLTLTGPAGGRWRQGQGGERIELDAAEFCWTVSGRAHAAGLLAIRVPF